MFSAGTGFLGEAVELEVGVSASGLFNVTRPNDRVVRNLVWGLPELGNEYLLYARLILPGTSRYRDPGLLTCYSR